jgi:hypothetical protein
MTKYKRSHERDSLRGMLLFLTSFACAMYPPSRARPGVGTWWTKIFQSFELKTDAYALSFYHTLAQIPGMMLATAVAMFRGRKQPPAEAEGKAIQVPKVVVLSLVRKKLFLKTG